MNKKFVLGIDIGGSHITGGLIDLANTRYIQNTQVRKKVNPHASSEEIIAVWASTVTDVADSHPNSFYNIGIAMPGPFDYENGICLIKGFNKYEALYEMDIRQLLSKKLHITGERIRFKNDAAAFLEGEVFCGAAKGFTNAIGITLGTGLGSAISKDGVTIDAELSVLPYKGDKIEEAVSTRGLVKTYNQLSGKTAENVKEIADKVKTDENAVKAFKIFSDALSWFLYEFIQRENPDIVVLGGNITLSWDLFMLDVISNLSKVLVKVPKIERAILGEAALLIGGACCFKMESAVLQAGS
ncbi:ROK family protein [Parasediminibacterium sp. JCM 36343]|uniref:ROK family protein n=1 Tax=Parasediminibacterium sp. JCM 36343 TaxID=3374279 RepID=UPI003979A8B7